MPRYTCLFVHQVRPQNTYKKARNIDGHNKYNRIPLDRFSIHNHSTAVGLSLHTSQVEEEKRWILIKYLKNWSSQFKYEGVVEHILFVICW